MYIDLFVVILLVWAILDGWRNGLIKELFNSLGVIAGLLVACGLYAVSGDFLAVNGSDTNMVTSIIAFLLLCLVMPLAFGFIANRLTAMIKGLHLGLPNSLLGAGVSVIKFVLLISFAFNMMSNLNILAEERTADSKLYGPVCSVLPFVQEEGKARIEEYKDKAGCSDTTFIYFGKDRK